MGYDKYVSPLSERYASKEMQYIFSPDMKFKTWRKLWIALAETEKELGLNITDEQIAELKEHAEDINYDVAKAREKVVRHDVMSHVYAYGQQCPKAKGIIHLGATSCYVGDNTDIIIMAEALKLVKKKLVNVLDELSKFADRYKDLPTLAFTHFQPAQPTTVGKRATLWMQEFSMDLADLDYVLGSLKLLGSKGTTGTQASFLELFEGDQETIDKIDPMIAKKMGFEACFPVSGQTYRRQHSNINTVLFNRFIHQAKRHIRKMLISIMNAVFSESAFQKTHHVNIRASDLPFYIISENNLPVHHPRISPQQTEIKQLIAASDIIDIVGRIPAVVHMPTVSRFICKTTVNNTLYDMMIAQRQRQLL